MSSAASTTGVLDQVLAFLGTHPTAKDSVQCGSILHTLKLELKLELMSSGTTWFKELLLATHPLEIGQPYHLTTRSE
jgi:hypothetical protein